VIEPRTRLCYDLSRNASPAFWFLLLLWCLVAPATQHQRSLFAQDPSPLFVEGYASQVSYAPGDMLKMHVSSAAAHWSLEIARLGAKREVVHQQQQIPGQVHAIPEQASSQGCGWPASWEMEIPEQWASGYYEVVLRVADRGGKFTHRSQRSAQTTCYFILRSKTPGATSKILFQLSTNTYNAYNNWGGSSLYAYNGRGGIQGHRVSFHRPPDSQFGNWELPFAAWAEAQGYALEYAANSDLETPGLLDPYRLVLSVGHDEYWTDAMYTGVQRAIEQGVSVGFFSGNAVCGKVEWNPQRQSLHRIGVFGPPGGTGEFESMSQLKHEPPYANALIGAHSTGPVTGGADWICRIPEHWVMEGTGMRQGDGIPGLIGWEWHGDPAPIRGLEILASGPTQSAPGQLNGGQYTSTLYPGPKGNWVFNASTIWWADGLSQPPGYVRPSVYTTPKGPDPRVQRITRNLLDRMIRDSLDADVRS